VTLLGLRLCLVVGLGAGLAACGPAGPIVLPSLSSPVVPPPKTSGRAALSGVITSPGGPFLFDGKGRVVFLHGVNAVYKYAPYELYPAPGKPWNFDAADASLMARLGFNVVRLGMTWKGLEPGTAPANDPAICRRGTPHDPGQFSQAILDAYLVNLTKTVDLLGRYHIYTLLDMHQDVYNEIFDGEGAPDWAVCTNAIPEAEAPGRWSNNYATRAAGAAYRNFWKNDVVGDLQGEYDRVWVAVANYFRTNPWVVGYDPFNEPFSTALIRGGGEQFDSQLECFYAGKAAVNLPIPGDIKFICPAQDPRAGLIPQIEAADSAHLIFYEPDIYASRGYPNFVGPMNFPRLVFNVHVYCTYRSGKTGNPTNMAACSDQEQRALASRFEDRADLGSPAQPSGPAWFVSEFGASSNPGLLDQLTADEDASLVGWIYWSWKYYGDPTGSADEALVVNGRPRSTVTALSRAYPEAVAGRPLAISFNPASSVFDLTYVPNPAVHAPTLVFVPTQVHYPNGYCATTTGARVTSRANSQLLTVTNRPGSRLVHLAVTPGRC